MLKYVGDGSWLPGIPARDLTGEEVEKYGGAKFLMGTRLYAASKEKAEIATAAKNAASQ